MRKRDSRKKLSIAFLGNMNNNYYNLIKSLDKKVEYQFTLYLNIKDPIINLPETNQGLRNSKVKKIRTRRNVLLKIFPSVSRLRFSLKNYDLVFLSAEFITLAPYCAKPTIFYPTGADLTQVPFLEMYDNFENFRFIRKKVLVMYANRVIKGIKSVNLIASYPFNPIIKALNKISPDLEKKLSKTYLPLALDSQNLSTQTSSSRKNTQEEYNPKKILIASRIIDEPLFSRVEKGSWKNISEFICGLKLFIDKNKNFNDVTKLQIQIICRENSPDFKNIITLLTSFELLPLIRILYPKDRFGFSRSEFSEILKESDLVIDEFGIGWYGSLFFEALSNNKCYMGYIDKNIISIQLKGISIHNCFDCQEIAFELENHFLNCQQNSHEKHEWVLDTFGDASLEKKFSLLIGELGFK